MWQVEPPGAIRALGDVNMFWCCQGEPSIGCSALNRLLSQAIRLNRALTDAWVSIISTMDNMEYGIIIWIIWNINICRITNLDGGQISSGNDQTV
jgi:hypothetical protein